MTNFPDNPTVGLIFTAGNLSWRWDGTKWVMTTVPQGQYMPIAGGQMTGPLLLAADPVQPMEATTKRYADTGLASGLALKVAKAGDTMSGDLTPAVTGGANLGSASLRWGKVFASAIDPMAWMAPGGRLTFVQTDPRPANAEGATSIYYVPYLHTYVSVPGPGNTIITMQIPPTGVVNNYSNTTTNPAAVPASAVHFGLFLWNNNGVLTLTRSPAISCATGGAVSPACGLTFGPNNMVVNTTAITNGPAAGMGLYVGTAFTWTAGSSYMRTGGANGGNFFGLANTYNRLTAATQLAYAVNAGPGSRVTPSLMFAAIANTGNNDYQRFSAAWGYSGTGAAAGIYSGVHLYAGLNSAAQTPNITWYTISSQSQGTSTAETVTGAPNLQPGCWTFWLGTTDAALTAIAAWGRGNTEFSLEI